MRQVLVNLLSNAMVYTLAEGTVTLSADVAGGGDAIIKISDTGRGMSAEEVKRAVTRFGHVEEEASRKSQGIGLGLPLAKSLTELLGGTMTIESSPREGTTITLKFCKEALCEGPFKWKKPPDRMGERARRLLADPRGLD